MTYEIAPIDEFSEVSLRSVLERFKKFLRNDEFLVIVNKEWFKKNAEKQSWPEHLKQFFEKLFKFKDQVESANYKAVQVHIKGDSIVSVSESRLPCKTYAIVTPDSVHVGDEDKNITLVRGEGVIDTQTATKIFNEASDIVYHTTRSTAEAEMEREARSAVEKMLDEVSSIGSKIEQEVASIYEPIIMSIERGFVPASTSTGFFRIIREVEKRVSDINDAEIQRALAEVKDMLATEIANVVSSTKVVSKFRITTLKDALNLDDEKLKEYAMKEAEKLINDKDFRGIVAAGVIKIRKGAEEYAESLRTSPADLGITLGEAYVYAVRLRGYTTADILIAESRTLNINEKHLARYKQHLIHKTKEETSAIKYIHKEEKAKEPEREEGLASISA